MRHERRRSEVVTGSQRGDIAMPAGGGGRVLAIGPLQVPQDALAALCARYYVRELALFGSALREDFREDSDIDLLVEFEPDAPIGLYEHFDLQEALAALFGRKVDLVSKRGLNPIIRDEVLASSEVVYAP